MNNSTLIPVFSGTLANSVVQLCDARTLHAFMQVKRDFTTWIKSRIRKFGFTAGEDFLAVENLSSPDLVSAKSRAQKLSDYHLTLDMAKELAMVENNEQGRAARRYFIACERKAMEVAAKPERISLAESLAAEAVAQVYRTVFGAVMEAGPDWQHQRYLLSLNYDRNNKPTIPRAKALDFGKMVVSMDELPDWINGPDPVTCSDLQLARLAMAVAQKQEFRAERRAEREIAQKQISQRAMPAATKAIGVAA